MDYLPRTNENEDLWSVWSHLRWARERKARAVWRLSRSGSNLEATNNKDATLQDEFSRWQQRLKDDDKREEELQKKWQEKCSKHGADLVALGQVLQSWFNCLISPFEETRLASVDVVEELNHEVPAWAIKMFVSARCRAEDGNYILNDPHYSAPDCAASVVSSS